MLLIELTYKKPIDEVNNFLDQHRSFLNKYYENGILETLACSNLSLTLM